MVCNHFPHSGSLTVSIVPGEIKLEMPSISVDREVSDLAADLEAMEILEQCVINWLNLISAAIDAQLKKTPQVTPAVTVPARSLTVRVATGGGARSLTICPIASFLPVLSPL